MQCNERNNTTMRLHTCRNCDMLLLPEEDDDLFSLLLKEDDTVAPVMIRDEYGEEYGEDDEGDDDRDEFNAADDEEVYVVGM